MTTGTGGVSGIRLGLRENWRQFSLLVLVNAFVGGMVGLERAVLPLLAEDEFGLASRAAILSFIVSFGLVKAVGNLLAGGLSDRFGRKRILLAGWLAGLPVPILLVLAPSWGWVVAANVLLGVNQGLCWSTTVIMKIDLVGPVGRGTAMGLNEAAGYGAVAVAALASGYLASAYSLRPAPFLLGIVFVVAGLALSLFAVRETREHARYEAQLADRDPPPESGVPAGAGPSPNRAGFLDVLARASWRDRDLSAVSQAGLVNNLNDGLAWGLFPLLFAASGMSLAQIGWLTALYPAIWGLGQLLTGALSDRIGRKALIVGGMWLQAVGIGAIALASGFMGFAVGSALLGAGTAMVYPTLLAAVGDVAHAAWRASAVGVYRLWRDLGYPIGALGAGLVADAFGLTSAIWAVAAATFASGVIVALRMSETLPARRSRSRTVRAA